MSTGTALLATLLLMSLVRSVAGWRPALLAGLVAVVNPFLLYYGQETRMYALLLALSALAMRMSVELCRRKRRWWLWAGYSGAVAGALYVHYYALLLLPVLVIAPLVLTARWRTVWWQHVAAIGVACALFIPWALTHADVVNSFTPVTAGNVTLQALLTDYLLNVNVGQIPFEQARLLDHELWPWLLVGLTMGLAVCGALRGRTEIRRRQLFTVAFVLPLAAAIILTLGRRDFSPRHGIAAMAGYLPLVALGLLGLPAVLRGLASLCSSVGCFGAIICTSQSRPFSAAISAAWWHTSSSRPCPAMPSSC